MATGLDREGKANCISCGKNAGCSQLVDCAECRHFVCKSCATYRRQGNPHGYVCKSCNNKLK